MHKARGDQKGYFIYADIEYPFWYLLASSISDRITAISNPIEKGTSFTLRRCLLAWSPGDRAQHQANIAEAAWPTHCSRDPRSWARNQPWWARVSSSAAQSADRRQAWQLAAVSSGGSLSQQAPDIVRPFAGQTLDSCSCFLQALLVPRMANSQAPGWQVSMVLHS